MCGWLALPAAEPTTQPGLPREAGGARDTAVLASDGLLDNLRTDEIVERARRGDPVEAARSLVQEARRRMLEPADGVPSKPDDLTLALFRP